MMCRCFGKTLDLAGLGARARQTAERVLGVPDYDAYIAHLKTSHPAQTPPTPDEFFAARQAARFAQSGLRCC